MTRSNAHTVDDIALTAQTLVMIAPSREFAAGVAALAHALNASDYKMRELILDRFQFWTDPLPQHQLPLAQK